MSDLCATLAEARDLFLEADFEQATEKFEAAKQAATAAGDADVAVAADTGLAEVAIQQKNWEAAVLLLEAAIAASSGAASAKPASLVRARYMLGLARMAQGRAEDARTEFEAALDVARDAGGGSAADAAGVRGDIEDRLAQLDEQDSLEEEELLEIAMEFGASAADDEYGPGEGVDDDDDDEEDDEDDEEAAGKIGAVGAHDDDDEEEDEDEDEGGEEDDAEEEAEAVAASRKRKVAPPAGTAAAGKNGSGVDNNGVSVEKRPRPVVLANGDSAAHAAAAGDDSDEDQE